jgi:hypothetical protein
MRSASHDLLYRSQIVLLRDSHEQPPDSAGPAATLAAASCLIDVVRIVTSHLDDLESTRESANALLEAAVTLWGTTRPPGQFSTTLSIDSTELAASSDERVQSTL